MPNFQPAPVGGTPPYRLQEAVSVGWMRRTVDTVNTMLRGKLNCTGEVTLDAGVTTTLIIDERISAFSCIVLSPLSENAAATQWWIGDRSNGSATINHSNTAATDRIFSYAIIG